MARPAPPKMELGFQDEGRLARGDMRSLDQGAAIGGRHLRLIIGRDKLKRTKGGGYDLAQYDAIINAARQRGISPQVVLDNRSGSGMGDPRKYAQFVALAARHFQGRVGRYSLINEPDLKMAPEKYRQLYTRGQAALNRADPHAQLLFGEFSPHSPVEYARKVLERGGLTAGGFAWHPYQSNDPLAPGSNPYWGAGQIGSTNKIAQLIAQMNLKTRAGKIPGMYMTEFGYGRYGNSRVSQQDAARFWPRALQKARDAGVREIIAYHLTGNPNPNASWDTGLLNPDGTPRPAYNTVGAAVRAGALTKYRPRKR
jgi:hypothetical protein